MSSRPRVVGKKSPEIALQRGPGALPPVGAGSMLRNIRERNLTEPDSQEERFGSGARFLRKR